MSFLMGGGQTNASDNPEFKKSPYQRDLEARAAAAMEAEKRKKKGQATPLQQVWDRMGGKVD